MDDEESVCHLQSMNGMCQVQYRSSCIGGLLDYAYTV